MAYKIPTPIYEKRVVDSCQRGYVYWAPFMIYTHGGLAGMHRAGLHDFFLGAYLLTLA